MIWLSWRQQRAESVIAAAILAALAALLIPTGIQMASAYQHDGLAACLSHGASGSCGQTVEAFTLRFGQIGSLTAWFTLIPGLIGALFAAPFIGLLEQGTCRLDWTQSITRRRWITGKLTMATTTALVASLLLTVMMTWWRAPLVHLHGRMASSIYDSQGIVVVGYTLFALGLALAIGVISRRVVPALIGAVAGYVAARIFVDTWLRQRLLSPETVSWKVHGRAPNLDRAWVLSQHATDKLGRPITSVSCPHGASGACKPDLHSGLLHAVYQPPSHFWALQGIETAIFISIAFALIVFAAWHTHQRMS
jgi:hypothetical protein